MEDKVASGHWPGMEAPHSEAMERSGWSVRHRLGRFGFKFLFSHQACSDSTAGRVARSEVPPNLRLVACGDVTRWSLMMSYNCILLNS